MLQDSQDLRSAWMRLSGGKKGSSGDEGGEDGVLELHGCGEHDSQGFVNAGCRCSVDPLMNI